jgi:hypothetical protein
MTSPKKTGLLEKIQALVDGKITRETTANWAQQWIIEDTPQNMPMEIWESLKFLSSADMISTDRPHLYDRQDFQAEINQLSSIL